MKIKIEFTCDFCGRKIDYEGEEIYSVEVHDKGVAVVACMCEDCNKKAMEESRKMFPKTTCGLN